MKKAIKTLVALVLALVLAASLSAAAWADGGETGNQNGGTTPNYQATVTVNGLTDGETVNAYKLISFDENYNNLVIADGYKSYLQTKSGNNNATDRELAAWLVSKDGYHKTVETLEGYLASEDNGLPAATTYTADANGTATLTNLTPGYYLLTVNTTLQSSNLYRPMSAFIYPQGDKLYIEVGDDYASPQTSATLTAKSVNGPTIDKEVKTVTSNDWGDTATAGVGDTAEFYVKIEIPRYPSGSKITMELTDTLTNMSYVTGSAELYSKFESGTFSDKINDALDVNTVDGLKFTLDYGTIMNNVEVGQTSKTVYLVYTATVAQGAAADGSAKNSAKLTYANIGTPEMKRTTDPSSVTVYNYAFKLEKKDILSRSLSGAEFTICTDEACNNAISFAQTSTDGVYEKNTNGTVTKIPADFTVKGLAPGVYYVKEIKTAPGYFLPHGSFTLTLTAAMDAVASKHNGELDGGNSSFTAKETDKDGALIKHNGVDDDNKNTYSVQLINSVIPTLPSTGGAGTAVFTVAGVAVMVLAAVLFLRRKKEEE